MDLRTVPPPARLTAGAERARRSPSDCSGAGPFGARDVSEGAERVGLVEPARSSARSDRHRGAHGRVSVLVDAPDVSCGGDPCRPATPTIVPATLSAGQPGCLGEFAVALGPYIHAERYEVGEALKTLPEVARHRDQSARCCARRAIDSGCEPVVPHTQVVDLSIDTSGSTPALSPQWQRVGA